MAPQQDYITCMQELAREAGTLLLSYFGKVSIEYKGEVDLVTEADRASEKLLVERIRKRRRGQPQRDRQRLPLVYRSSRRNNELCPRLPGFLRFSGP
jgi:hypothetical protein